MTKVSPIRGLIPASPPPERTRVCGIVWQRNAEHEMLCRIAIGRRVHPAWSQSAVSFRISERVKLRKVLA